MRLRPGRATLEQQGNIGGRFLEHWQGCGPERRMAEADFGVNRRGIGGLTQSR